MLVVAIGERSLGLPATLVVLIAIFSSGKWGHAALRKTHWSVLCSFVTAKHPTVFLCVELCKSVCSALTSLSFVCWWPARSMSYSIPPVTLNSSSRAGTTYGRCIVCWQSKPEQSEHHQLRSCCGRLVVMVTFAWAWEPPREICEMRK